MENQFSHDFGKGKEILEEYWLNDDNFLKRFVCAADFSQVVKGGSVDSRSYVLPENEFQNQECVGNYASNYRDEDDFDKLDIDIGVDDVNRFCDSSKGNEDPTEEDVLYEDDLCCPEVSDNLKPKKGAVFNSYDEAVRMYKRYAFEGGFDVRQGHRSFNDNRVVLRNYLLCNREEMHNHKLISKENMYLSRASRQVDFTTQSYIYNMAKQNIGATKAHRVRNGTQGSYGNPGGLIVDWKNAHRNLNCFIGGRDAKMLVDKMYNRKNHVSNFTFEFRDKGGMLDAMFWADETAKYHYNVFGDVVSFDATYSTNRYNMVFVPFTGIDNHRKCVNFGAGLLSREDTNSYVWLLRSFLKAFGKEPTLVVTDQDPAMKNAIREVFPNTNHRFCMWHITSKIPKKVSWEIANDSAFNLRFNGLVWNSKIDEAYFEAGWEKMLVDFNLENNTWLNYVYGIRRSWIPAYFKNVPMSGLMKTTSLSESANWSFQNTTLTGSYLVPFMDSFESSMEIQRHTQNENDFATTTSYPVMLTYLTFERHAARVYTRRIFYQVQEEIFQSQNSCSQKNVVTGEFEDLFYILEKKNSKSTRKEVTMDEDSSDHCYFFDRIYQNCEYKVTHDKGEGLFPCSCKNFEHVGVLCRHIFCVLKYYDFETIPERYVLRRWCRDVIPSEIIRRRFNKLDIQGTAENIAMDINTVVEECVAWLRHDEAKLTKYLEEQRKLKDEFNVESLQEQLENKDTQYAKILGVTVPDIVDLQNPDISKNKGHGSRGKRLKSKREMKSKEAEKPKRLCHCCNQYVHHDKRNCPDKDKH